MATEVYVPQDVRLGIKEQATWGTAELESAAFKTILADSAAVAGPDVKILELPQSRANRYMDIDDFVIHEKGAMPRLAISGFDVRKTDLADFLYAFFQKVTEGAATPYSKTFTFNTAQPDFTNSGGFYLTVAQDNPGATDDILVRDCIVEQLAFKLEAGDVLRASANMVGRGTPNLTGNMSGTWTVASKSHFHIEDLARFTINFGGEASPTLIGLDVNLVQTVFGVGQDSGDFATLGLKGYGGELTLRMIWNGTSADCAGYFQGGTRGEINFGWGNASAGTVDGDLDFTLNGFIDDYKHEEGDALIASVKVKLVADATNSKVPATIILADAVDRSW